MFDHRISVRVTGQRDGWFRTMVNTPVFELRSDAQFGGVWTQSDAVKVARDMFAGLAQPGDVIHIDISGLDGSDFTSHHFAIEGK